VVNRNHPATQLKPGWDNVAVTLVDRPSRHVREKPPRRVGRRGLISGALLGTGAVGLGSWLTGREASNGADQPDANPSPDGSASEDPQSTSRFAGDPGIGKLLLGISLAIDQVAAARAQLGGDEITMSRRFYRAHQLELMQAMVRTDATSGIVPFVSLKTPGSWRAAAEGRSDRWLESAISKLGGLTAPAFLSLHHEPEDNHAGGGNTPEAWVEMHRRATVIAQRHPQVTIVPVLMQWTFDPASKRDPQEWLIPEHPVLGVDIYNPWRTDGSRSWVEFDALITQVRSFVPMSTPIIVPEFGSVSDQLDPMRTALWLRAAYESALKNNVAGLAWFDSEYNNKKGDLRLNRDSVLVLRELLARPETVRWNEIQA
jgi:hypothetical protein